MKKLPLAALFGTACIYLSAPPIVLAEDATELEEIVVTADRKARTVDETLAPVTIITRQDIEKYQASDIADVLRRVPGVNIKNDGGAGKTASVFMRGTNSSHVLVLVDGVKMGSATLGTTAFEYLPLEQVERIEIVRGPRSSLYGSEAIGGVIQIFTRKGGKGFQPEVTASMGSHNAQKLNVNIAGGDTTTWFNANAGTEKTDGIDSTTNQQEPDKDGFRRESAALQAGHRFGNGTEIETAALRAQGKNNFDGDNSSGNSNDFVQESLSGKIKHRFNEKVAMSANLGQSRDETYYYFNGGDLNAFAARQFDTLREMNGVQTDIALSENAGFTAGFDQQHDKITSDSAYTVTSRKNDGVFASYQQQFNKTDLELSARHDDNEQFGHHNTGAVAVGHNLNDSTRIKASYGTAFKAPTFGDLYSPFGGNPKLTPEKSRNTELGISRQWQQATWEINAFHNTIDDLIEWVSLDPADPYSMWEPANTEKAKLSGLELAGTTKIATLEVRANATIQRPQNASGENDGKLLRYRPQRIVNVDIDRDFGKLRAGATLHGESKRYNAADNNAASKLPGYATLDLRADYQLSKDWTIGAKVGNVLDKDYQTNRGYNQDGINGLMTIKYAPK